MKSWNNHAWYCTGILLALLVGTLSVKWNTIEKLPELISFAVGLSSLVLAVFAIIQSLTANNHADSSLISVRDAAEKVQATLIDVSVVAKDLKDLSGSILSSAEGNRIALAEIKSELVLKSSPQSGDRGKSESKSIHLEGLTFGGATALYAAVLSMKNKKDFTFADIFPKDSNTSYETGYLGGLSSIGFIKMKRNREDFK